MSVLFANRFKTTLSGAVTAAATVLPLSSVVNLPAIGGADYCYLTLVSADQQTIEVVKATAVAGNNVTVTRAQEGTGAVAWDQGIPVELRLTTQSLLDALADRLGVHATADAALKLATPRAFSITGDISWTVNFDGSADASAAGTIAAKAVTNGKLADMSVAGVKGALAAGATTDLTVGNLRTLLSITNVENKDSATIRGELTSANVTGALGFTPEVSGNAVQKSGDTMTGGLDINAAAGVRCTVGAIVKMWSDINGGYVQSYSGSPLVLNPLGNTVAIGSPANVIYHVGNKPSKADVGLGNADDTSDANKPVSTAQQAALDGKAPKLPQIQTVASSATVTPTFANDQVNITAQAAALNLANPTGTAADGWGIAIRIKDNGTARAITYGTQYRAVGVTLPTTTVVGKTLYIGMIYNAADTKWDVVAVAQE